MCELEYDEDFGKDVLDLSKKNPYVFLHLGRKLRLFGKTDMKKFKEDAGFKIKKGHVYPILEISIETPPGTEVVEVSFTKFYKKLRLFKILNINDIKAGNYSESLEEELE